MGASGGESDSHAGAFGRTTGRASRWTPSQLIGAVLAAILISYLIYEYGASLLVVGALLVGAWGIIKAVGEAISGNQQQKVVVGPPLHQLLFEPPPSECLNRAEGFMVKEGFTVNRGGSSVSFASNTQFEMGAFVILLLLGIIPGLLYAIYMSVRKGPSVTLVATSTKEGTQLDVVGTNAKDRALLENWIKGSQGIPKRPA